MEDIISMKKSAPWITIDFLLLVIFAGIAAGSIPAIFMLLMRIQAAANFLIENPQLAPRNYKIFQTAPQHWEPIKWALVSVCFIIVFLYLCVNILRSFERIGARGTFYLKSLLVILIIVICVFLPVLYHITFDKTFEGKLPQKLSQNAQAMQKAVKMLLLERKNPYNGSISLEVPAPEAGTGRYKVVTQKFSGSITALVSSLPVCIIFDGLFHYYDQRLSCIIYLVLLVILVLNLKLSYASRIFLLIFIPLLGPFRIGFFAGSEAIVGVFWLVLFLWGLLKKNHILTSVSAGLAALSHPFLYFALLLYLIHIFLSEGTFTQNEDFESLSRRRTCYPVWPPVFERRVETPNCWSYPSFPWRARHTGRLLWGLIHSCFPRPPQKSRQHIPLLADRDRRIFRRLFAACFSPEKK